jgi:ADP-heptose:LPS heptosyltransferase
MPSTGSNDFPWINPIGGLGDALMLSGVLSMAIKADNTRRYNLVRRTHYTNFFRGHPAISTIGFPPPGARIVDMNYWSKETLGGGAQRPFQILARLFGLNTPVDELLFLPEELLQDSTMEEVLRGKQRVVVIAPASASPRKNMLPHLWQTIVERLAGSGAFVIQVGRKEEIHIKNAYSLLGVTTPRQLAFLIRHSNLVISADNFIMHLAHLEEKPAVVIWGPTRQEVYGYDGHVHFQTGSDCPSYSRCLGPDFPENYATPCPMGEEAHCTNSVDLDALINAALLLLGETR